MRYIMKKRIVFLGAVLALFLVVSATSAENAVYFSQQPVYIPECGNATVDILMNASDNIDTWSTMVEFDSECVNITEVNFTGSITQTYASWGHHGVYIYLGGTDLIATNGNELLLATLTVGCNGSSCGPVDLGFAGEENVTRLIAGPPDGDPGDTPRVATMYSATWTNGSAQCVGPDTTPPASVSDLEETDTGLTWIQWSWTNPTDADFKHTEVWLDGEYKGTVAASENIYNATGLEQETIYELGTRTVDESDNVNQTWMNDTATTLTVPDTTPPASVSDLEETDTGLTWIQWSWTNPTDADFKHTEVWLDGEYKGTVAASENIYNATGLEQETIYELGTRTVDESDNVNQTWMNDTATTLTPPNRPPVSDPNGPYTGTVGETIRFNGSGSYDPDGSIANYTWDFGDGNSATGATPTHTYAQRGTYTVTLNVTDNEGATDTNTTTATISSGSTREPDLTVKTNVTFDEDGKAIVNYTVTNIGSSKAGESTTCLYVDSTKLQPQSDLALKCKPAPTQSLPCPALKSGGSYSGRFKPEECPCGDTLNVTVCADYKDAVNESNETNNCLATEVECPPCGPTASYGKNVHSQRNVLYARGALGEPDDRGALMYRHARIAIKLEDTIPYCEKVSVRVRRVAGQAPKFTVEVSSDGKSWTKIGKKTCTSFGWTLYDFNGNWDNVKYIRITKPGSSSRRWWQQLKLMGLDAVYAEGKPN
ncbi:PKD repeat-containing protein [Candidatus Methanophagaceae archaeon]|nr:PKD repeat-containing protein [Methanophagales archaeon]